MAKDTRPKGLREDLPFPAPRREIFSWCMFDFANSSFTTVVVTVVFSVYFTKVVCGGSGRADFYWSLATFLSQSLVLLTAPVVGAIADYSGLKKRFLTATWLACCLFTALLALARPGAVLGAMALFILANVAYSVGENLIASFLPEIARPEDMGKVSGFGWAWGYMGGLVSLALCYPLIRGGIDLAHAASIRRTNLVTGLFFFLAGLPTILVLRERQLSRELPAGRGYLAVGFASVRETISHVRRYRELAKFLVVFLVFNCGIVIVVSFASIFAERTLGFGPLDLMLFFLIVQVTSAVGAFIFGFIQDKLGARITIQATLLIWLSVTLGCYFIHSKALFYVVGNLAGLAIGSSQSASRAFVGILSPPSKSAEMFGFWGLFWKLSAAVGPLAFGVTSAATGSQRKAILVTGIFFLAGFLGMFTIDEKAGIEAASQE